MEIKQLTQKLKSTVGKYRYALIVLAAGLLLLMLPGKNTQNKSSTVTVDRKATIQALEIETLTEILQSVEGAGKVKVLLSTASGEKTVYQTNSEHSTADSGSETNTETVIITDSQRNESGLIQQINPPTYLGAIVVCEGADSPAVKLAITQAVAKITGLGADAICVLKMK